MSRVFISNAKVQETENADIQFINTQGIEQLHPVDTSGNITYVIDVHCAFTYKDSVLTRQEQGGVIIYRQLLSKFKECQDKLKVVFYSPISAKDLSALKPENYVLTLLPFIELFPENSDENEIPDWTFEKALQKAEEEDCPQFNNASENLLSGWSLYKADRKRNENDFVETFFRKDGEVSKRTLVFIDDQITEWQTTYNSILEKDSIPTYLQYDKKSDDSKRFDIMKITNLETEIKNADLVISDFYLEEPHEPNCWMSKEQLEKISGFQLFEKTKGRFGENGFNKGVPYVMHTSSNKITYYRILDANGIDNWLVKDIRTNSSIQEKIENYRIFKNVVEEFTSKDSYGLYKTLKNLWSRVEKFDSSAKWWQTNGEYNKDEIVHILKSTWFALRGFVNKQDLFMEKSGVVDVNFTPAAIISSLGKLNEIFNIEKQNRQSNSFQRFLVVIRNAGSHYSDFDQIQLVDSIIFFDCWLNALNSSSFDDAFKANTIHGTSPYMIQDTSGSTKKSYKYRLLYLYMQFYNSPYSHIHHNARNLIRNRVNALLLNSDKKILLGEVINHIPKDKDDKELRGEKMLKDIIADTTIMRAKESNNFFIKDDSKKIFICHL